MDVGAGQEVGSRNNSKKPSWLCVPAGKSVKLNWKFWAKMENLSIRREAKSLVFLKGFPPIFPFSGLFSGKLIIANE